MLQKPNCNQSKNHENAKKKSKYKWFLKLDVFKYVDYISNADNWLKLNGSLRAIVYIIEGHERIMNQNVLRTTS